MIFQPVRRGVVTSEFTEIRGAGIHGGIDIGPEGQKLPCEIYSVCDGTIVFNGWENDYNHSQGFGYYVIIEDKRKSYHFYGHLEPDSCSFPVGTKVKGGDKIGMMGNSGHSFGAHLHYGVSPYPWIDGKGRRIWTDPKELRSLY